MTTQSNITNNATHDDNGGGGGKDGDDESSTTTTTTTLTILGFGSLLSEHSSRTTFPQLQHFRLGRLLHYRRVFAHPASIFFQRGIANLATLEMASLSVEPCPGASCVVAVFEVPKQGMLSDRGIPSQAFLEREEEFDIVPASYVELDNSGSSSGSSSQKKTKQGIVCQRSTDEAYMARWGQERFQTHYQQYGLDTIWNWPTDSKLRPCAVYLRHCYLAAQYLGSACETSFLDETFLIDRTTTVREYLQHYPQVLQTLPPPALAERYGGPGPAAAASATTTILDGRRNKSAAVQSAVPSPTTMIRYNFLRGHPNRGLLPLPEMQTIFQKLATTTAAAPTQTDAGDETASSSELLVTSLNYLAHDEGSPATLQQLRAFIDRNTAQDDAPFLPTTNTATTTTTTNASADDNDGPLHLFLTHGVSHGLEILCAALTKPGDMVWMERPTYFLAADIFRSHHLQIVALPMTTSSNEDDPNVGGGGRLDVDLLEEQLKNGSLTPPRMIYIIPTHHNPTADTMTLPERLKLVQLAEKYNFLIVADEVYHLLDWRDEGIHGKRPPRMAAISLSHCISVSSFTKTFCPGIRLGWIEASKDVISSLTELGYIKSQGGCAPFMGELMRVALSEGLCDSVLTNLIAQYKARSEMLVNILQTEPGIRIHKRPLGGFFVWISFDGIDDTANLLPLCNQNGVHFLAGTRCGSIVQEKQGEPESWEAAWCRRSARLCFADMNVADVEEGAKRLVKCYQDYMKERKG